MNLPAPVCVLVADSRRERFALVAYQWAALRGMPGWRIDLAAADFSAAGLAPKALIALSYRTLVSLNPAQLSALASAVGRGATPAGSRGTRHGKEAAEGLDIAV